MKKSANSGPYWRPTPVHYGFGNPCVHARSGLLPWFLALLLGPTSLVKLSNFLSQSRPMNITSLLVRTIVVAWTTIAICLGILGTWSLDRTPPIKLLSSIDSQALPGSYIVIHAKVKRDLTRHCAVDYSRYMYDGAGVRYDLQGTTTLTEEAIQLTDKITPDALRLGFVVPQSAHPGPASLVSVLEYRCNPLHRIWPIEMVFTMPFTVL